MGNIQIATLVLALSLVGAVVEAADLTGTWEGKQNCERFDGATSKTQSDPSTLAITQTGSDLNIEVNGILPYNGYVVDDADKPDNGEAGLLQCGMAESAGEVGRLRVVTKPDSGGGSLSGSSTFAKEGVLVVCKWKYIRMSTVDPAIASCP